MPPVSSRSPSGVNATCSTPMLCPASVSRDSPVAASHTWAVPSSPPVAIRVTVGAVGDAEDIPRVAGERGERALPFSASHVCTSRLTCGGDACAIGAERDRRGLRRLAGKDHRDLPRRQVPDRRAEPPAAGHPGPVGAEGGGRRRGPRRTSRRGVPSARGTACPPRRPRSERCRPCWRWPAATHPG